MGWARLVAAALAATALALALSSASSNKAIVLLDTVIKADAGAPLGFKLCSGELAARSYRVLVCYTSPVTVSRIAVLDWEQLASIDRVDLYGYLAASTGGSIGCLSFTYPRSAPCWPIYVIVETKEPQPLRVKAYTPRS